MHLLDKDIKLIEDFVLSAVEKFKGQNGQPSSIGIYCCPWSGWVSANFNIQMSIQETKSNCPDFEFVEFDLLELEEWRKEYESDEPTFKFLNTQTTHNHDFGDEKLNEFFFELLNPIAKAVKDKTQTNVLLQFLDSNCVKRF